MIEMVTNVAYTTFSPDLGFFKMQRAPPKKFSPSTPMGFTTNRRSTNLPEISTSLEEAHLKEEKLFTARGFQSPGWALTHTGEWNGNERHVKFLRNEKHLIGFVSPGAWSSKRIQKIYYLNLFYSNVWYFEGCLVVEGSDSPTAQVEK